jgi:hypothetical protein
MARNQPIPAHHSQVCQSACSLAARNTPWQTLVESPLAETLRSTRSQRVPASLAMYEW